jgi:polyhydroxyalkanoate synthesis regulator phasin
MTIRSIALWNSAGEVRRIDLRRGLNIITGESQTGKSALIEIIRYCLGGRELRVPAGPIASTAAYYGLLIDLGDTPAFLGRPALATGQQTSTEAQLEIGLTDLPAAEELKPNTNTDALRDWLGRAVGIEENRFDPPAGATRPPLVAAMSHALIHCFQRQDEIASQQLLFHGQAEPFVAQAIKDTLPYFLGATGPEQLRKAAQLRELRRTLSSTERSRQEAEQLLASGAEEASRLLSQASDAGLLELEEPPELLPDALSLLATVRDSPIPVSPPGPSGSELDRIRRERRALIEQLRALSEQRALANAISRGGDAAEDESVEQIVRLQPINVLPRPEDPSVCPICEQPLDEPPPAVDQLRASLDALELQIAAVERDRPGLVAIQDELDVREASLRRELQANRAALDALAASAEAVEAHQSRLDQGAWVRGRIDHYLEKAAEASDQRLVSLRAAVERLRQQVAQLEEELDPARIREAATSILIGIGRRMTEMAQALDLEHAESNVRVDLSRLTVVADTDEGPVYLDTSIGSGKNWVGYHLATVLSLQEYFVRRSRPVPSFLVLDQPTQAFFPADRPAENVDDQDRADALAQFDLMNDVVAGLDEALQVIVLDHADFDVDWFQASVRERWRAGEALIPQSWLQSPPANDDSGS